MIFSILENHAHTYLKYLIKETIIIFIRVGNYLFRNYCTIITFHHSLSLSIKYSLTLFIYARHSTLQILDKWFIPSLIFHSYNKAVKCTNK